MKHNRNATRIMLFFSNFMSFLHPFQDQNNGNILLLYHLPKLIELQYFVLVPTIPNFILKQPPFWTLTVGPEAAGR